MSERIEYFDILRASAIFGVIAIHTTSIGLQFSEESINYNFTVLWHNSLNFSVPMFLAISGFFLSKKNIRNHKEYAIFLKKQIPRVYIPLLIWSSVWFCLAVLIQNKSIAHEFFKLVFFQSSGTYYFIALIIQYYLLLPIIKKLANIRGLIISIVISIAATYLIFYIRYYTEISLPLILYAGNFITWLMFFVLGLYLGTLARIDISNKYLALFAVIFYALSCIESYLLIAMFHQTGDAVTAVKASSFLYSLVLIIFLFKNQNWISSQFLKTLGEMSYGIYLIHMLAITIATKIILQLYPPLQDFSPAYQFILIGVVILSCFVCISVSNYFFSIEQSKLLGFK